jgi:hypothetical protein
LRNLATFHGAVTGAIAHPAPGGPSSSVTIPVGAESREWTFSPDELNVAVGDGDMEEHRFQLTHLDVECDGMEFRNHRTRRTVFILVPGRWNVSVPLLDSPGDGGNRRRPLTLSIGRHDQTSRQLSRPVSAILKPSVHVSKQ